MEPQLLLCISLLLLSSHASAKRGYLFTSPKALFSGSTETFYLTLFDVPDPGNIELALVKPEVNESKTIATITQGVDKPSPLSGQTLKIDLLVPKLPQFTHVTVKLIGTLGTYVFENSTDLTVHTRSGTTFVQTDKPIYKPGQLVQFRILPVDANLKPTRKNTKADIWVESPSGIRLAQWLEETFEKGMSQHEMQLTEKPDLGTWTIYVNITIGQAKLKSHLKTETFKVEEYVLPKFEVVVTPPPYALIGSENFTWTICGRYTYGKLVKGNLTLEASFERQGYWGHQQAPKITHTQRIEGCTNFTVYEKDIGWQNYTHRYRPFKVFAQITEDGTELEQNSSATILATTTPVQLEFTSPEYSKRHFKPGMPFTGEVTVKNPDNTPKPDEKVRICAMATAEDLSAYNHRINTDLHCKNFTSNQEGTVKFTVPPKIGNLRQLLIQADAVNFPDKKYDDNSVLYQQPSIKMELSPWYSNAKRYVKILPIAQDLQCNSTEQFKVYLNGEDGEKINLHTQVMSKEGIVSEKSNEFEYSQIKSHLIFDESYVSRTLENGESPSDDSEIGIISIPVEVSHSMAPKGYLLIYYVTPDGEIIADSVEFKVDRCLKNKVGMEYLGTKELPGKKVGIKVTASPKSLCGIEAVDKSVYLLSSSKTVTIDKVFEVLNNYGSSRFGYSFNPTKCVTPKLPEPSTFGRRRRSPLDPPYKISSTFEDSLSAFQDGNFIVLTDLTLVTKPCSSTSGRVTIRPQYAEYAPFPSTTLIRPAVAFTNRRPLPTLPAATFPPPPFELNTKPIVAVRNYFPETWLFELNTVDDKGELIEKRELPHTITEWIGSAICIHPEDGLGVSPSASITAFQPFFVSATLPYSVIRGEILPVVLSVFNYLKECMPITLKLDESKDFTLLNDTLEHTFCVCGGDSVSHKYLVQPKVLGQLNFTSHASTTPNSNVCGNNIVGNVTARDAATNSLLVEAEGFKRQQSLSSFFCPSTTNGTSKTIYELEVPENYVADSGRAEFLVTGDLMGPALNNIDNLVQMPTGCGEQNMLHFVPDIFILDYLTNTGKLTKDIEKKLLEYLKTGYQRELTYRHADGSYSAFGNSDPVGSIWLSSFVVKAYKGASKYIFVDKSDITRTSNWIIGHQDSQGCFPEIGEVHHSAMKGGTGSNLGSKATLTSYILISLLEAQQDTDSSVVQKALSCLNEEKNPTTYTLALMTYASCLAKAPDASQQLENLLKLKKTKGSHEYWEDDSTHSVAIQIETASYAILSLLTCGGDNSMETALPIVRWISQKRNANGGFISTQDTVMALQALALYSTKLDKNDININVKMEAKDLENKAFHVDESNKLLVQTTQLPDINTPVAVEATGTGCTLVQTNLFYNVITPPGFQAFDFNISTVRGIGGNCKKAEIVSCINYNYEHRSSNMAILELRLPSGYETDRDSVELLRKDRKLNFKRSEIDGNKLAIYFSKVDPVNKCFIIKLDQVFEVQNLQPSSAKLWDYYQPENQISRSYNIDEKCPQSL